MQQLVHRCGECMVVTAVHLQHAGMQEGDSVKVWAAQLFRQVSSLMDYKHMQQEYDLSAVASSSAVSQRLSKMYKGLAE